MSELPIVIETESSEHDDSFFLCGVCGSEFDTETERDEHEEDCEEYDEDEDED